MNRSLQRGYLILTALLLAIIALLIFVSPKSLPEEEPSDTSTAVEDSLVARYHSSRPKKNYPRKNYPQQGRPWQQNRTSDAHTPQATPIDTTPITRTYRPKPQVSFELNSADSLDLVQLRGIGPVFSRRIIRYRQLLGGYVDKQQLLEVYGMTDTLYRKISPYLTLDTTAVIKLNLNTSTLQQLKSHPYLSYYQAKSIVNYRQSNGPFRHVGDIRKISLIDDTTYRILSPYLEI